MHQQPKTPAPQIEPGAAAPGAPADVHCVACGYNLRGLTGDPVCCPECGRLNRVQVGAAPQTYVEAELAALVSGAKRGLWAALLCGLMLLVTILIAIEEDLAVGLVTLLCLGETLAFGAVAANSLAGYRASSHRAPGWLSALLRAWACGLLRFVIGLLMCAVGFLFVSESRLTRVALGWLGLFVLSGLLARWALPRLKTAGLRALRPFLDEAAQRRASRVPHASQNFADSRFS